MLNGVRSHIAHTVCNVRPDPIYASHVKRDTIKHWSFDKSYRPFQTGLRFSIKASIPSRASSLSMLQVMRSPANS